MNLHHSFEKVLSHFNGNKDKAYDWFNKALFEFNMKSANELIATGKHKLVVEYINKTFL